MRSRIVAAAAAVVFWAGAGGPIAAADLRVPPPSQRLAGLVTTGVPVLQLPGIDRSSLLADEGARGSLSRRPARVASVTELEIVTLRDGAWTELADGGRVWRLRLEAAGATDLACGFSRLHLPEGASLYVVGEGDTFQGPYGGREGGHMLWTAAVAGQHAVVELFLPAAAAFEPQLELRWVARGFRGLFDRSQAAKQGSCHIDVVCPEGEAWRDEIRSVVLFTYVQGPFQYSCTGTLVRDVGRTLTPYILSSAHCLVDESLDQSVVVYWNFESPACGRLDGGSMSQNQSGAIFRASRSDADFLLLELEQLPDESFGVYYAGWDARADIQPRASVGIHHPAADEKAISFDLDPLNTINSVTVVDPSDGSVIARIPSPWRVDGWEIGATEPGSSGSSLWDADTRRIVGQLAAGNGNCEDRGADYYAKLARGWEGEDPSSRLRDWLDPGGTGVLFVNGTDPAVPDGFGDGDFSYFVPAIVRSPGVGGSLWRSSLAVLNGSDTAAEVTFTYFWSDGPTSSAKAVNKRALSPGSLVTWDDAALTLFGVDRRSAGAVLINSTRPLVVTARTSTEEAAGTYGSYMPGIEASDGVGSDGVGVLSPLRGGAEYRSNVGVVNLTEGSCEAQVQVRTAGGAAVGTAVIVPLDGYGFHQIDDVFAAAGAGHHDEAYATVEPLGSGCRVWAYAAVIDGTAALPGTNDPTTIPLTVVE